MRDVTGQRQNVNNADFEQLDLDDDTVQRIKASATISMGSDLNDQDFANIASACEQIIRLSEYRAELSQYMANRIKALAPNLTALAGETVGARLIARAGSLRNLAKFPGSTIQLLGAEKALFRALKTKSNTPKYGVLFHASLVGQASTSNKGKVSCVYKALRIGMNGHAARTYARLLPRLHVRYRLNALWVLVWMP
jgi:nucleolar protein 58